MLDAQTGSPYASLDITSGDYDTGAVLPTGSYRVRTTNWSGLVDLAWPDRWCPGGVCDAGLGTAIEVAEGQARTAIDFALVEGARPSGLVLLSPDGTPVEADVSFESADGAFLVPARSDEFGFFRTRTGLPPGDWRAVVYPQGGRLGELWPDRSCRVCDPNDAMPIIVEGDGANLPGFVFTLDLPARIGGRILDDETSLGIQGAQVRLFDENNREVGDAVSSAADGSYEIADVVPGTYYVDVSHPLYGHAVYGLGSCTACAPADGTPVTLGSDEYRTGVDVEMVAGASIAGRILGAQGVPLQTAVVLFTPEFDFVAFTFSGSDGHYTLAGLQAGDYLVTTEAVADYLPMLWPDVPCSFGCTPGPASILHLGEDEQRSGVDITAVQGARIFGRVTTDPTGTAVTGARVTVLTRGNVFVDSDTTDADGDYALGPFLPGEFVVRADNAGPHISEYFDDVPCVSGCAQAATPLLLAGGDAFEANFALRIGGRIAGRVTEADGGAAITTTLITVLDANGTVRQYGYTDDDGDYITSGMESGTYFVRTDDGGRHINQLFDGAACYWCLPPAGTPVNVVSGATTEQIDFSLARGARLSGLITDASTSQPLPYHAILAFDAQGRFVSFFNADQNGVWQSPEGFAPGTYYLRTITFGSYRDELYGGLPCPSGCDVRRGTPVQVLGDDIEGLDFALEPALFVDGFEYPLPF